MAPRLALIGSRSRPTITQAIPDVRLNRDVLRNARVRERSPENTKRKARVPLWNWLASRDTSTCEYGSARPAEALFKNSNLPFAESSIFQGWFGSLTEKSLQHSSC